MAAARADVCSISDKPQPQQVMLDVMHLTNLQQLDLSAEPGAGATLPPQRQRLTAYIFFSRVPIVQALNITQLQQLQALQLPALAQVSGRQQHS